MKVLALRKGKWFPVFIDREDADIVAGKRLYVTNKGYVRFNIRLNKKQKEMFVHQIIGVRLSKVGLRQGEEIDHVSGDRLDCRRTNLRITDHRGNVQNTRCSKYRGTTWHKTLRLWQAQVNSRRKCYYLGVFKSRKEAAKVALAKRTELGFLSGAMAT